MTRDRIFEQYENGNPTKRFAAVDSGHEFDKTDLIIVQTKFGGTLMRTDANDPDGIHSWVWTDGVKFYAVSRFGVLFELVGFEIPAIDTSTESAIA